MANINTALFVDSGWTITFTDQGNIGRNKYNPLKLNLDRGYNSCQHSGCITKIRANRYSGLCDLHQTHQHDLLLELTDPNGIVISVPMHTDIIDKLMEWANTRNFDLKPLFTALSFNILGNIPDVSTLSGDIVHIGFNPPTLQQLVNDSLAIINQFLPSTNNGSYQPLITSKGPIPARILALTFAGLILCEEANRGDRWFWRIIKNNEGKTYYLGGAMAIAYFATMSFNWGIEIGKAAPKFVPSGT